MKLHYGALIFLIPSIVVAIIFGVFAWLGEMESRQKYRDAIITCIAIVIAIGSFTVLISD